MVYNEKTKESIYRYRAKDPERWKAYQKELQTKYRTEKRIEYNEYQRNLMRRRNTWLKVSQEFLAILLL